VKYETTNAWQSLAYSLLGTVVLPLVDAYEKHSITYHYSV